MGVAVPSCNEVRDTPIGILSRSRVGSMHSTICRLYADVHCIDDVIASLYPKAALRYGGQPNSKGMLV